MKEAVTDFLKWVKLSRAESTYHRIAYSFEPLLEFFGENTTVDKIEKKDVERFVFWRKGRTSRKTKEPITRETINRELYCLKMIFRRLCDAEVLEKNVVRLVKQLPEMTEVFML